MQTDGQIQCNIAVNGKPVALMGIPGLQCHILQNVRDHLPSVMLHLPDFTGAIDASNPINDGTQISITLGDTTQPNQQPTVFRAFGTPKRRPLKGLPDVSHYMILGKLDSTPFVTASPNAAFTGTSNAVMQQIATTNGFKFSTNVQGNDSMTWLPGRKTFSHFADHITQHAYVDGTSTFAWHVDEAKNLMFSNIPKLFNQTSYKAYIYHGAPVSGVSTQPNTTFPCIQYKVYNRSGVMNAIGAYGLRTSQQQLTGIMPNKYLAANATVFGNNLDINSAISSAVQPVSRMHLVPSDTGSSHAMYMAAKHQNRRLSCAYCQNLYVLMANQTKLNVFDYVKFTTNTTGQGQSNLVDGNYVVTAISRVMWSGRYYEKIELSSNGPQVADPSLLS